MTLPLRTGVIRPLEDAADELLRQSLANVTSHEAKRDILTPWKQYDRQRREVYTAEGVPEAAVRTGMYHRALNRGRPDLNSRDGIAAAVRGADRMRAIVEESGGTGDD